MSASGYTPIILYSSQTATNIPSGANLALGELAINTTDGILYYKTTGGTVTQLAKASTVGGNFTNIVVSSTSQLGTVSSGTWNGTAIGVAYGGTGLTSTPANGQLDIGNGTGFTRATLTAGTGVAINNSAGAIQISATGTGGGTVTSVSGSGGSTGLTLTGGPIYTSGTLTLGGTLNVANGGTGVATTPSSGSLLIGNGSGYTVNTLSAGSGITITNGSGNITISSTGASGVTAIYGSSYISASSPTGSVTLTNTGVTTVNGTTGNITNVAITSSNNTFTGSNNFNSGTTTFNGSLTANGLSGFGASNPGSGISGLIPYAYFKTTSNSYFPALFDCQASASAAADFNTAYTASALQGFFYGNISSYVSVGSITTNGSSTSYNTSSDRRLKTNITTLSSSGNFIDALKPRNFTWINTGLDDSGFIADEMQQVVPNAVHGEPNAVDANGNPKYQQVDSSAPEIMANIIAELQSLRKRVSALESNIKA
jgi:Chaperone of endosialidase